MDVGLGLPGRGTVGRSVSDSVRPPPCRRPALGSVGLGTGVRQPSRVSLPSVSRWSTSKSGGCDLERRVLTRPLGVDLDQPSYWRLRSPGKGNNEDVCVCVRPYEWWCVCTRVCEHVCVNVHGTCECILMCAYVSVHVCSVYVCECV